MYNDIAKADTIEKLKKQYKLDSSQLKQAIQQEIAKLNKVENELNNYIKAVTKNLDDLQNQVDGNITTWFFSGVPTLENKPAEEWIDTTEKDKHIGDLYYDQETGYAYRFQLVNSVYSWNKLTDNDVTEALALANAAKDTADSKRRVFITQPSPPYDNGDFWINNNEIYICQIAKQSGEFNSNDFINSLKYTDDTKAEEVDGKLTIISRKVTTIEKDVNSISQKVEDNKYYVDSEGNKQLISSGVSNLEQNTKSISLSVSSMETNINDNLNNNYYKKEQINKLIIDAESGLTNIFTSSGGNNLLRNTAPWYMKSENTAEFWNGNLKQIVEPEATSGYAILIQNGTISQSISLPSGTYSVSFKYKKLIDASEGYVRYNGKTFNLTETSGEIHSSGEITNNQFIIEINSNTNDSFEIYDLILKHGSEGLENMLVWTQNANESRSDTVQISEGITTTSSVTDTKATMDSEGFIVRNKTTGTAVMEATKTGGKFLDLTSTGKSNLSGLLVQKVGSKICINGESGS